MKLLRFGICAFLAFSVLAHGGVEDWARAVFETGAGLLFLYWALRLYRRGQDSLFLSPLLFPLAAFLLIVLAQWVFHATVSTYETRVELQLLLADFLILFLAVQVFRTLQDWKSFVWFVMIFAFGVAIFGILQHLTFNGKLYWFREMRYGGIPFGPYVNRNHFAGFAELTIPLALIPLILGKVRRERLFIVAVFAVVQVGALLLSASRGGIVSFGCQLAVLALWMILQRAKGKQLIVGATVLLVSLAMVSWLGARQILQRFSAMQSLEVSNSKRLSMWHGSWHIFLDHPVLGTGLGTLQTVYPRYETLYDGKVVNHSHNDYLEALAETGILGGLFCASFLGVWLLESRRRLFQPPSAFMVSLQLAGFIGCFGFLVHSFVDFNLHIPANALLFFLTAHLASTEIQAAGPPLPSSGSPRSRNQGNH
jgi:O-antigen ligase